MAKDINQSYVTFGNGREGCLAYMEARVKDGREMDRFRHFIFGYLTAFNLMIPQNFNILGERTLSDAFNWLDGHCRKTPDDIISNAVAALTQAYFDERKSMRKHTTGAVESDPLRRPGSPQ